MSCKRERKTALLIAVWFALASAPLPATPLSVSVQGATGATFAYASQGGMHCRDRGFTSSELSCIAARQSATLRSTVLPGDVSGFANLTFPPPAPGRVDIGAYYVEQLTALGGTGLAYLVVPYDIALGPADSAQAVVGAAAQREQLSTGEGAQRAQGVLVAAVPYGRPFTIAFSGAATGDNAPSSIGAGQFRVAALTGVQLFADLPAGLSVGNLPVSVLLGLTGGLPVPLQSPVPEPALGMSAILIAAAILLAARHTR